MLPSDLDGWSSDEILTKLFGDSSDLSPWRSLERVGTKSLKLRDLRLRIELPVTQGFLVALQEVSNWDHARSFAQTNKILLIEDRALATRGNLEIAIRCATSSQPLTPGDAAFTVNFDDGTQAYVGRSSLLFRHLIIRPAAEQNATLPDPGSIATLVITNVDRADVPSMSEACLFHLRRSFPRQQFNFISLDREYVRTEASEDGELPAEIDNCHNSKSHPWAIAFYNRALESESISAFLYMYRVLEACFDMVLSDEVRAWRRDSELDDIEVMKRIRKLTQKEDIWALRQVVGRIVRRTQLDRAAQTGLIREATADELVGRIYSRRNEIAHGRLGQHDKVLVPFAVPVSTAPQVDELWFSLMRELADECIARWILRI